MRESGSLADRPLGERRKQTYKNASPASESNRPTRLRFELIFPVSSFLPLALLGTKQGPKLFVGTAGMINRETLLDALPVIVTQFSCM